MNPLIIALLALAGAWGASQARGAADHRFTLDRGGEAVATITAGCERCDWGASGREAVVARVTVDGAYSQHLILTRGSSTAPYRIMLGALGPGAHRLAIERDVERSSKNAGELHVQAVEVRGFAPGTAEHEWLAHAPFLHPRPGTMERFSDLPLLMWVERAAAPATGYRYSVIFTHEDGGTPTDRLMATWGRTTDIEFVYGTERGPDGALREEIQAKDHAILPFRGTRFGTHPLLWVATENNMFADSGPGSIRFAPAPELVSLDDVSREVVMDRNPWTYAVMAAELRREGRIDPAGQPGSARVPDPRQFAYLEACGELDRATLAFDVGVTNADGTTEWYATDRGEPRFRIARSGCFRAAVPVAAGVTAERLTGVRARAYTRPSREGEPAMPAGTGRVLLKRMNGVFMLDENYRPGTARLRWTGAIEVRGEAGPVPVTLVPSAVVLVSIDGFPAAALQDPDLPAPTLRALIAGGASAGAMTGVNPTVTWPTHTTFVTGVSPAVHGVLFNGLLIREPGTLPRIEPWRDKKDMVLVDTVYDAAYRAGLTTAQVDWVAVQNPVTITWEFRERPEPDGVIARGLIGAGLSDHAQLTRFRGLNPAIKDQIWTSAAVQIIERHQPNLLMVHLLALDSAHHRYGPGTPAAYATIAFVDAQLARIVDAVRRSPMRDRTTILVVSDHGFKTATRSIRPNALLRKAGLLTVDQAGKAVRADAFVMSEGGTALVYALGDRERLLPKLAQLFRGAPGIERIIEPAEYAALGYPHPDRSQQMGDLVLVAKEGHSFSGEASGEEIVDTPPVGFHGAMASDPGMDSIFVASGFGIRPGVRVERVSALQVAPTIAALLDLRLPAAGPAIDAILSGMAVQRK